MTVRRATAGPRSRQHEYSRRDLLKHGFGLTALAIGVDLLAACAPTTTPSARPTEAGTGVAPAGTAAPTAAAPSVVKGGTFTEGVPAEPAFLNPILLSLGTNNEPAISTLYEPLIRQLHNGEFGPALAEALPTVSADGLSYTFKLRKDIKWTDGKPITAEDVVFTYRLIFHPDFKDVRSPYRSELSAVLADVSAPDPTTVVMRTKTVNASFLGLHGHYYIMPKHVFGSAAPAAINTHEYNTKPVVTSGPFKFQEWVKGSHIAFTANEGYYLGRPNVDRYIQKFATSDDVLLNQLEAGELETHRTYNYTAAERFKNNPNFTVERMPTPFNWRIYYNLDATANPKAAKMFSSKNVRKALLYAVNRPGLGQSVMRGNGHIPESTGLYPPNNWAYKSQQEPKYPYDKKRAEDLLDAEGWKRGPSGVREKDGVQMKIQINGATNPISSPAMLVIQQNWKEIGVEATIIQVPFSQLLANSLKDRSYDVIFYSNATAYDPDPSLFLHSRNAAAGSYNYSHYKNSQLDALLEQGIATTDKAKRKEIYGRIQDLVNEDVPLWTAEYQDSMLIYKTRLKNYGAAQRSGYNFLTMYMVKDVWLTDGK